MDFKKEIEKLLFELQKLGIDRRTIEIDLDYSEFYIDQILSKGGNEKFLKRLQKYNVEKSKTPLDLVIANTTPGNYLKRRLNTKNVEQSFRVPLVSVKARAGYVTSYQDIDLINSLDKYAIPPGVSYTGAIWRYFEVDGDSMDPALNTGDYVLCSQVPQEDWENIRNFYVYVLVTDENVMIKRIFVKENGDWVLISDNETHSPQRFFDINTLKELWVFRRLIKKTISAKKEFKIKI